MSHYLRSFLLITLTIYAMWLHGSSLPALLWVAFASYAMGMCDGALKAIDDVQSMLATTNDREG